MSKDGICMKNQRRYASVNAASMQPCVSLSPDFHITNIARSNPHVAFRKPRYSAMLSSIPLQNLIEESHLGQGVYYHLGALLNVSIRSAARFICEQDRIAARMPFNEARLDYLLYSLVPDQIICPEDHVSINTVPLIHLLLFFGQDHDISRFVSMKLVRTQPASRLSIDGHLGHICFVSFEIRDEQNHILISFEVELGLCNLLL
ncbi:hypothetical protein [Paenibacillus sp. NPDC058177]|uniref:hypothetical protein n=1 Tax=Paenibacillus sp. NPDC058177 TaxID=3346369 RepID=UPI0036DD6902